MAASSIAPLTNPAGKGADVYRTSVVAFTPSTSYPALGEPITAAQLGLGQILHAFGSVADNSRLVSYDPANASIRIWTALGVEAGTGTDQSTKVVRLTATGL